MNTNSKEFFINLKPREIPFWDPLYGFDEQDDDVKQFWDNEANKLINGVTINGVFIHPWLYWHLNFWNMMLDKGEDRVPGLSELRDNEWLFAEILQQAERENKGIFMFGTRRFGKALLDSEIVYCEDHEKKIGDVSVGDYIYDDSGHLTEVTGVYPQGKVMTYRVTFEDGRNAICCGEHLWKVKTGGRWTVKKLKEISMLDYKSMSIPICKPIDYPNSKLPIPASAYGSMLASYLTGYIDDVPYDYRISRSFLRSSIKQKETFINSFIKSLNGVVTGNEEFVINTGDMNIIKFVLRMFWSSGWYSKLDGNKLILSNTLDSVKISSIDVYGKYTATCITVNNESKLFLTTNYIVTHNTAIMSSFLARNATMTYNLTHNVIGGSKEDLMSLSEYLEFGLDNIHPYLKINRTGNDWFKEVIMGVKNVRNERDVHARIRITNIDQGKTSSSLKTAGGTPYTSIYDEVGKFPFLSAYLAGKPAHMMKGRMRGMILAAGCVCAGSIVYKANGEPCKIEDLKQEDGIIGYNTTTRKRKKQNINWMKEPSNKYCVKIRAEYLCKHISIECSYDHPFYSFNPKGRDRIYTDYVPAILLRNGDEVGYVDGSGNLKKAVVSCINYIGFKKVYNLNADGFNNYIANGFLTHNTGGNVDRSQDAQKVMNDPASYDFVVMNYDLLNKRAITPTWRICKSGCFVPGQMSHAYEKKKETLDEYLGIKNAPGLRKIPIYVTDFEKNTELIKQKREELSKKDKELFVNEKMAYPLTIDDCFLNTNVNRFPVEDALIHKSRLLEEGRRGKAVDIYKIGSNKIGWNFSDKQLAPYPFKGGNIDAPVVIYEDPPEEGGEFNYTYVSGLDPFKNEKADTESLGAFYILKRLVHINDPFAYKIAASYVSRPPKSDDFCRTCEDLIEAYGAKCLMENADRIFELYLARRHKEMILLEDGEQLANRIIKQGVRQNNKLGLSPTVPNQRMLFSAVLQYCWEEIIVGYDEDGNEIKQKGIYRIDDIELLDEIIAFGPGVNTDRIIAFGHALLLARYYDDMNFMPESPVKKYNEAVRKKRKIEQYKGFVLRRHNPFKMR